MDTAERARVEPLPRVPGPAEASRPRDSTWAEAITLVVLTRAALMLVGFAAAWYLAGDDPPYEHWSFIWTRWDASILLNIARFGYTETADPHATAFFPGFSLLLMPLNKLWGTVTLVYGALLLNTVASIVAVRYLILLGNGMGEGLGRRAGSYLLLFPTAVFLIAPYTEALFLAGAVPAFYYARRGSWLPAGLAGAVAMTARFAGVFLILGLIVEWFRSRRKDAASAAAGLVIALLPLVAYCAYLAATRGDPFYFFVDQREGWGRQLTNPITSFVRTWDTWSVGAHPDNWRFAWRGEIVAALAGIGFVVWALRKREWGYATFMGSLLVTLLVSTWYFSIPRMLLTMFPIVLFLAAWTRDSRARHEAVLLVSGALCVLGVIVFTQGAWFY